MQNLCNWDWRCLFFANCLLYLSHAYVVLSLNNFLECIFLFSWLVAGIATLSLPFYKHIGILSTHRDLEI